MPEGDVWEVDYLQNMYLNPAVDFWVPQRMVAHTGCEETTLYTNAVSDITYTPL
jgi:hypothetical protein